jgi:prolipoprotein diacylglyceryltransferase
MKTRTHPTHHDNYRPGRLFWGVGVALCGVFGCVFLAMLDTEESPAFLHIAKVLALWAGGLAFVGGTVLAGVTDITHRFARCPSCGRLLLRSRIDYRQSYYPCRRCDVTWTCPCCKSASGS